MSYFYIVNRFWGKQIVILKYIIYEGVSMNKLLMTGTINPSVYNNTGVVITDVSQRLYQYEHTIERYIKFSDFDCIIFAENSK